MRRRVSAARDVHLAAPRARSAGPHTYNTGPHPYGAGRTSRMPLARGRGHAAPPTVAAKASTDIGGFTR
ncbi:hypothetical protein GCM10020358_23790 [Amorphoplanes nipponensis]